MGPTRSLETQEKMPLPGSQFSRFLTLFHVVFIGGLLFSLFLRWRRPAFAWGVNDTILVALVVTQVVLYTLFFVILWKPATALGWWLPYFGISFALWVLEWRLEDAMLWVGFAYLGQMFGVLRPRISIPLSLLVFAAYFLLAFDSSRFDVSQFLAGLSLFITVTGLGLFIHRLTITSTERAELIQQLETANRQIELSREKDVELAALRERERLARDLHDSLGHGLVTLTVQLEAVQRLYAVDPAKASAMLDEMKELTRTSMEQLRRSLAGLRAPGLGDHSLPEALKSLCNEVQSDGLKLQCALPAGADALSPAVSETLWRVAQEALHNVRKHANAQTAGLSLGLSATEAVLRISDDGIGISNDALCKPGHYGLRGLRERVEGLGGRFIIQSNAKGTCLEARIPIVL